VEPTDVDAVADELYALHPGEFIAARDARVKAARAAGDRDAAARIAALRKPTVVAWLANLLARESGDHVRPLLELGGAFREATANLSGPQLRELSRQRNELVAALVREARALGAAAGQQRIGEDTVRGLEATLHAALADPDAARRLVEGRLTEGLTHTGFTAGPGAPPSPRTGSGTRRATPTAADERRAAQRARLEDELGAAWTEAGRATERKDEAQSRAQQAQRRKTELTHEVGRLRDELERAEAELGQVTAQHGEAAAAQQEADRDLRKARKRVAELQARLNKL
jgi:hypothetical protein